MNEKLKSILEERKKAKAKKAGFKQTSATKTPADAFKAPKDGPNGAGAKSAKTGKVKTVKESTTPAFGARFNSLFEKTMADHNLLLSEDDASDLYYEFNDELGGEADDGDLTDVIGGEEEVDDQVTVTLDKQTARTLIDLLTAAVGPEESEEGLGDEEGGEFEFGGEEEQFESKVVEEEGHYEQSNVNLGAGEKLANPGSKVVKSKLGARPGKAGTVKTYDSSGKLTAAPTYKKQEMSVKSASSSAGKDLF